MRPVFPTKTFPNHYSIVTGLYSEEHGIVGNTIKDPEFDEVFTIWNRQEVENSRWWGGEPIWATAEKQGLISASFFWVGSEALIATRRPTYWVRYNRDIPYAHRVRQVLNWLDYPEEVRPSFMTLYFEGVDLAGHSYGPDFDAIDSAVREVDNAIGYLLDGLRKRSILDSVNILIVSDHGMAHVDEGRTIWLDDYINPDSAHVIEWGPVAQLWPPEGSVESIVQRVARIPRMRAYRRNEVPDRLHYRANRRIAPLLLVADEGWTISRRGPGNYWSNRKRGGNHGYDNESPSMRALCIAYGPAFRKGTIVEPFENVHVYSMMAHILNLVPAPNSGSFNEIREMLR